METLFYINSFLAIIAISNAMISNHTVHALLSMILGLLFLASSMYLLAAHLAAALLVIVYAGAIMVLFAFAIMLLEQPQSEPKPLILNRRSGLKALLVFMVFWGQLSLCINLGSSPAALIQPTSKDIAMSLFGTYGLIVELSSLVLLAGLASAIYAGKYLLAHRRMGASI